MDSRQLHYFSVLAETCHFGQAAEALHVTSSALSQTMRQLEAELDVVLFHRSTRQVTLTPAGLWLQEEAEQIMGRLHGASLAIQRFSTGAAGKLRLGFTGTSGFAYLPRIARELSTVLKAVDLSFRVEMLTPQQCELLRTGALDLGLLRPPAVGSDITTVPFAKEPLLLAFPADHPLAHKSNLRLADLKDEPWVAYRATHSLINAAATRLCRDAGFEPRRARLCWETTVIMALVAAGMGIAMVPGGVQAFPMRGVVLREVPGAPPLELVLAYRADSTNPAVKPAVRALSDLATRERELLLT
jgi:DNA-binding transcriptional LysR family regulator